MVIIIRFYLINRPVCSSKRSWKITRRENLSEVSKQKHLCYNRFIYIYKYIYADNTSQQAFTLLGFSSCDCAQAGRTGASQTFPRKSLKKDTVKNKTKMSCPFLFYLWILQALLLCTWIRDPLA